jgi:predicted nucleic acid-binding protein
LPIRLSDPLSYDFVFELAERHSLTLYDAAYLDLAVREGLPIASLDSRPLRVAAQSGVGIFQP